MADLFEDQEEIKETPDYIGHRKRLRERFLKEPKALADYELLEVMLFAAYTRRDTKPIAKELIAKFGSFAKVLTASEVELSKVSGVGEAAIVIIKSAQEGISRLLLAEVKEKPVLNTWLKLLDYCRAEMGFLKNEQFRILFLNSKNMLIADEVQGEGTINHTLAYPREIVKRALELGAASIILCHNHPSGDPSPSRADIDLTQQIIAAAKPLELKVHDHLIISETEHFSFKSNGLI